MLRYLAMMICLLLATGLARAEEAARVVFVVGQVQSAGQPVLLNNAVQEGAEVITGNDGYVYLKTIDNGFLILRPNSHARIAAYHVDTQTPANTRIKLELLNGVARSISGQAVKQARQNFRFNTPVAAIGVRGTDFTVYTDQQTSRVAVISGGVIVSGFTGVCGPEGGGPCEGSTSRELFADQAGQFLQIQKGQAAPQLLRGNGMPLDRSAPPRLDEPTGKAGAPNTLAVNEVSLEPQKLDSLRPRAMQPVAPAPELIAPPDVAVVIPPKTVTPEILWGRWQTIAALPTNTDELNKLKNGDYNPAKLIGPYFIARAANAELVMPQEGRASFGLVSSEVYLQEPGRSPVAGQVQNSHLDIDFATRSFATGLTVVAGNNKVDVQSQGDVSLKGELVGNLRLSNASVAGYLTGAQAKQASYIFISSDAPTIGAFGATRWSR